MESLLEHMIADVTRQRQAIEEECKVLNELLKPWPGKFKVCIGEEERTTQVPKLIKPDAEKQTDTLNPEEQQAILQVNELLCKAQKTFSTKAKNEEMLVTNQDSDDKQSSNRVESSDDSVVNDKKRETCQRESIKLNECEKGSLPKANRAAKSCTSSRNQGERSSKCSSQGSVGETKLSHGSSVVAKGVEAKLGSAGHRPSSGQRTSRPTSGKSKHVPAHMTAPFKTNENMKFPQRRKSDLSNSKTNPPGTGARSMSVSSKQVGVGIYRTLPAIKPGHTTYADQKKSESSPAEKCLDSDERLVEHVKEHCKLSDICAFDNVNSKQVVNQRERFCDPQLDVENNMHKETEYNSNLTLNPSSNYNTRESVGSLDTSMCHINVSQTPQTASPQPEAVSEKKQPFTLKKNGSSIKFPAKLMKLIRVNSSLREKCSASRLIKKVSSGDTAQLFINKLMAQEEIDQELWMFVCALTCLRSHQILLDTLKSLNLANLSENSSAANIYRAKKILEFVLSAFADLQETSDYFSKVQFRSLQPVEGILQQEAGKDINHELQEHLCTSSQWAHLKFTEKYMKAWISVSETAQLEWVKIIHAEQRDPQVLQAVYGILTSHGQFLPTLVESPQTLQPQH